jgi:hypothetical protein
MARDAVLEVNIENPAAREAFINFWRTMEAQGYQYGYEALCNVWVGFDDGRAALAEKVFETLNDTEGDQFEIEHVSTALRDLFQREGISLE